MARIMIIDDEPAMVEVISTLCRDKGHEAYPFNSAQKGIDALQVIHPQLVITDLNMESIKRRGFDVLKEARELSPPPEIIVVTGYPDVGTAVEALTTGARDYIIKPFKIDELEVRIKNALELQDAVRENVTLKRSLKKHVENVIGTSDTMQEIYNLIGKVADTDSTILIQGESGTGKELVARALHFNSSRQHHPFVAINCSALPENLLESELFGHKKGAFTGAVQDKVGLFEEAQNGTIFLDEINSMAQQLQTKLLRVLQERQIRRVGDTKSIPINVRVLAASNEPLQEKIKASGFREDLYYRLAVIPLEMPPLRDRVEDIELLARHFIEKNAAQTGTEPKKIDSDAMELLTRYRWPGNVRELENAIERACALCEEGVIRLSDLPPHVVRQANHELPGSAEDQRVPVGKTMDEYIREQERDYIERTIKYCNGSRDKAAKTLGISMATLYRKLDVKGARAEAASAT
jgi:two-component system, NtrC family, response regulator AtoC